MLSFERRCWECCLSVSYDHVVSFFQDRVKKHKFDRVFVRSLSLTDAHNAFIVGYDDVSHIQYFGAGARAEYQVEPVLGKSGVESVCVSIRDIATGEIVKSASLAVGDSGDCLEHLFSSGAVKISVSVESISYHPDVVPCAHPTTLPLAPERRALSLIAEVTKNQTELKHHLTTAHIKYHVLEMKHTTPKPRRDALA